MDIQRRYYEVSETNEGEGETWHFFVPLSEAEAERLRAYVEAAGPAYRMGKEPTPEITIEVLMGREGSTSYYGEYNRCAPLEQSIPETFDPDNDRLYKGSLFKVVEHCLPPAMELD